MEDEVEEKEFPPTPQKLLEARKKGEVPKSTDINTALAYLGFLCGLYFVAQSSILDLYNQLKYLVEQSGLTIIGSEGTRSGDISSILAIRIAGTAAPFLLIPFVLVLASIVLQRSLTFVPSKIGFKLNRISPISGIRNKFGRVGLFEFLKSLIKLIVFIAILYIFLNFNIDRISSSTKSSAQLILLNIYDLLIQLISIVFAISLVLGVLDYIFQYSDHIKKNKMSRKEIEDEIKQSEGDPTFKQVRRQKAMSFGTNAMLTDVPNANVVIVNPTHFAVALRWERTAIQVPVVVAKGRDEVAAKIREIARVSGVPIHSNPPAARSLYADIPIGQAINVEHYEAVAAAIRFAENIRKRKSRSYAQE